MKRMITQELINKIEALVNDEKLSYFLQHAWFDEGDLVIEPDQIHLQSEQDITISDLGSLFPTPTNGKFLRWYDGVLENSDIPEISPTAVEIEFTEDEWDEDETAYIKEIQNMTEKSLYRIHPISGPVHQNPVYQIESPKLLSVARYTFPENKIDNFIPGSLGLTGGTIIQIINGTVFSVQDEY